MKKYSSTHLLILFGGAVAAVAAGCSTAPAGPASTGTGTGGSTGSGGSIGGGTGGSTTVAGVALTPDASGWIMADAVTNITKGIQGAWYGYGDHYGTTGAPPGDCETKGMHPASACSVILHPVLPAGTLGFPNTGGKMCTDGTGAVVVGTPLDYSNIWGAGIALDLNATGGAQSVKQPYNAVAAGVTGFSFDIDTPPLNSLRVEFPVSGVTNAPYWKGAASMASPVVTGINVVRFTEVNGPLYQTVPLPPAMVDATKLLSIQFHVFTSGTAPVPYSFCISNLKALTN